MKQLRVTTSHDSTSLPCAKICAQTIPIIFRTRHPKRNRSWQPCRPFRSVFFHCRYHSWQCAWPGYVVSASDHSALLAFLHTGSTVLVLRYCTTCTHKARTCSWRKRSHCFLIASIPPPEPSGEVKQYTGLYFQIPSTSSLWPRILQIRSYPPNGIMENWNIPSWSASCGHVGIVCVTLESQDCDTAKNSFKNSRVEAQTANSSLLWDWLGIKGHPHVVFLPKMSQITILASQQNMHWNRSSLMCPHTSAAEYSGPSTDRPHPAWRCHIFTVCKIFGKEVLNRNDCNISKQQL